MDVLLVAIAGLTRRNIAYVAVYVGPLLSVASLVFGMAAAARLHRARGVHRPGRCHCDLRRVPVLGLRDLRPRDRPLVRVARAVLVAARHAYAAAYSSLLRSCSASARSCAPISASCRSLCSSPHGCSSVRRGDASLVLGAAAIALPFAYEIFRAGFYGTLVPLPALAKNATDVAVEPRVRLPARLRAAVSAVGPLRAAARFALRSDKRGAIAQRERILVARRSWRGHSWRCMSPCRRRLHARAHVPPGDVRVAVAELHAPAPTV